IVDQQMLEKVEKDKMKNKGSSNVRERDEAQGKRLVFLLTERMRMCGEE
ncbi:hypothetical protein A2U01_0098020, partial [Trifolium medium]|nr:hypothetical protein [Trifolium medium]